MISMKNHIFLSPFSMKYQQSIMKSKFEINRLCSNLGQVKRENSKDQVFDKEVL